MLTLKDQYDFGREDGEIDASVVVDKHHSLNSLAYRLGYSIGWRKGRKNAQSAVGYLTGIAAFAEQRRQERAKAGVVCANGVPGCICDGPEPLTCWGESAGK